MDDEQFRLAADMEASTPITVGYCPPPWMKRWVTRSYIGDPVGGFVEVNGKKFAFPKDSGYGLINLGSDLVLIKFDCILESVPPQGYGEIIGTTADITLENGQLKYLDQPIQLGLEVPPNPKANESPRREVKYE